VNEGINWSSPNNVYWKHDVERSESVKIILHGNAEFEAKDVVLKVQLLINSMIVHNSLFFILFLIALLYQGNHVFEVPDGQRMCIVQDRAGF
jgi:UTP---glucose-1-phosphate uridylyltransferase